MGGKACCPKWCLKERGYSMANEFKNITLTGRLCYLFMCIEKYLVTCYPDKDWTCVAKKCWQWTNKYWNEGENIYAHVVPEFLLEFDNYRETNEREFDGELLKEDYLELVSLYKGITDGSGDAEIDEVLMLPVDFNNECEGTDFRYADESTLAILERAQDILKKHNIELPDIEKIINFKMDHRGGWGELVESEHLSIVLNARK